MLGLRLHLFHQPRPLDDLPETGIVLDIGRRGELTAGWMPWITIGERPARAAYMAAVRPAGPEPSTATRVEMLFVIGRI